MMIDFNALPVKLSFSFSGRFFFFWLCLFVLVEIVDVCRQVMSMSGMYVMYMRKLVIVKLLVEQGSIEYDKVQHNVKRWLISL